MSHPFEFPCAEVPNENILSFHESLLARAAALCGSLPDDTENVPPVQRQSESGGNEELPEDFSIKSEPAHDSDAEASLTCEGTLDTRLVEVSMDITRKGEPSLVINGYKFTKSRKGNGERIFWRCSRRDCGATATTNGDVLTGCRLAHTHREPSQEEFLIKSPERKRQNVVVQVFREKKRQFGDSTNNTKMCPKTRRESFPSAHTSPETNQHFPTTPTGPSNSTPAAPPFAGLKLPHPIALPLPLNSGANAAALPPNPALMSSIWTPPVIFPQLPLFFHQLWAKSRVPLPLAASGNLDGISGPGGLCPVPQTSGLADNQQPNLTKNEPRENEGPDTLKHALEKTLQASIRDAMNALNSDTASLADKNTALSIIKKSLDILERKTLGT